MSFTGDLEYLPIVDVIQLLHATRKSGILHVRGRKGESQLVFKDGFIVSASHLNNRIRIGQILVERQAITQAALDRALAEQQGAGQERKPLIVTLLEKGLVQEKDAYKGLQHLIEMTIVEILTWKKGSFVLDMKQTSASDEYKFYPERMGREISIDTQGILMDALRIYDEKMRDGELEVEDTEEEAAAGAWGTEGEGTAGEESLLSAEDLGLADLDQLDRKIPGVFTSLEDPAAGAREKIRELAADLGDAAQQELLAYLAGLAAPAGAGQGPARAAILLSPDELLRYAVTTVCTHEGIQAFATGEAQDLDPVIDQYLSKNIVPALVIDRPAASGGEPAEQQIVALRQQIRARFPQLPTIQLAAAPDHAFALQALADGVRAVFPRTLRAERPAAFVADTIGLLEALRCYLKGIGSEPLPPSAARLREALAGLRDLREAPEMAYALLRFVAQLCERSLTLIVGQGELIAERGIGIRAEKGAGATPALGWRIPLAEAPRLRRVIEAGRPFFGKGDEAAVREHLFAAIGTPRCPTILLLPLRSRGRTLSLTYGDFGDKEVSALPLDTLEMLAGQAGLLLENAFYRKKLEKPSP
jgi:DNA-binding NarL/FixJ family response regulator